MNFAEIRGSISPEEKMGRKSVRENKNVYQTAREELGLTREAAEELLEVVSSDRIEKIESEKTLARPDEVLRMAECYKKSELCNYYCSHECPIGEKYVQPVEMKDLSQITLEVLSNLNILEKEKSRLIEITVDGVISEDEKEDFELIKQRLDEMAKTISSLSLWADNAVNTGKIKA